jgi:hypothetical protein
MAKFQIVTPHHEAECIEALDEMLAHDAELLSHVAYGCHFGDHTGYAVIEAANEAEVRSRLPKSAGKWVRIVEVEYFAPEDIRSQHDRPVQP